MKRKKVLERKQRSQGFTVLELMTIIAILGVLATVATPALIKYLRRSKTVEAVEGMSKIASGARIYHTTTELLPCTGNVGPNDLCVGKALPTPTSVTLLGACQTHGGLIPAKFVKDFDTDLWKALLFQPEGRQRYQYSWDSISQRGSASATIVAVGDLDCDGIPSVWVSNLRTNPKTGVLVIQSSPSQLGNPLE